MTSIHAALSPARVPDRSDASESYWDFGDRRDKPEDPIHRIHSYPAKFPAFITTKALQNFWGFDINPVATLIARAKTRHYRGAALEP